MSLLPFQNKQICQVHFFMLVTISNNIISIYKLHIIVKEFYLQALFVEPFSNGVSNVLLKGYIKSQYVCVTASRYTLHLWWSLRRKDEMFSHKTI
jgi:hypothetical protein